MFRSPLRTALFARRDRKKRARCIFYMIMIYDVTDPAEAKYVNYTVREKYEPRFLRHLLRALPFIVFAIRGYCCILFAATLPKILPQKVQSNQKRQDGR